MLGVVSTKITPKGLNVNKVIGYRFCVTLTIKYKT